MAIQTNAKILASEPAGILKLSYFDRYGKIDIDCIHVGERVDGFALPHIWVNGQPAHCLKGFKAELIQNDRFVFKIEKIDKDGELFLTLEAQERVSLKVYYQNQEYPLKVNPQLTLLGLKKQLQRQLALANFKLCSAYNQPLDELKTLSYYKIGENSYLFIQLFEDPFVKIDKENEGRPSLEGPTPFSFTSFNKEINLPLVDSAPIWCRVIEGFNLVGQCQKEGCPANNEMVCIFQGLGIGTFYIEKVSALARCPMMGHAEFIEVTGCIFWNCKYIISGKRMDKTDFPLLEGKIERETARAFAGKSTLVEWNHLEIVTENIEVHKDAQQSHLSANPIEETVNECREDIYHASPFPQYCNLF